MFYCMWKKRKLSKIVRKMHSKRRAKERCVFWLSFPELDAITGAPRPKTGVIIIHPIHALLLLNRGLEKAKKAKDLKTQWKLKGYWVHVQTIVNELEMARLAMQGEEKLSQGDLDA